MADYNIDQQQIDEISWRYTVTAVDRDGSDKAGEYIVFTNGMAMKTKDANGQEMKQLITDFKRFIEGASAFGNSLTYMVQIERQDQTDSLTSSCLFPAADDLPAATSIWRFMADHLEPGWQVSLLGEGRQVIQQLVSGNNNEPGMRTP
jgi:hypothetical protein